MKRLRNNIISVIYSFIRFALMKLLHGKRFSFMLLNGFLLKPKSIFLVGRGLSLWENTSERILIVVSG